MTQSISVASITHPYYDEKFRDWQKWRYTYEGGQRFIDNYLQRYGKRESATSFQRRRQLTYNPAFAKQSLDEIRNSIFQRLPGVTREGGSATYTTAMKGEEGGVDMLGSSMTSFIGRKILPELLVMGRVGVYIDMPEISGLTIADAAGKRPYIYIYRAEDIRSWSLDESTNENEFTNILLRDYVYTYDDATGLPTGLVSRFRRLWVEDGGVKVQFFNQTGTAVDINGAEDSEAVIELNITRIPFILTQLGDSLLADVANYQIALLNISSSDLAYTLFANFPFYTEQYDPVSDLPFAGRPAGQTADTGGLAADANAAKTETIEVGTTTGRRYPKGTERPQFVHPSSEPLTASMKKQDQLKLEIRQLVHLAVMNLATGDSKQPDQDPLESGLSYIGLELENMERKAANYWSEYEKGKPASVYYPEHWHIRSQSEIMEEVTQIKAQMMSTASVTYQKACAKAIAKLLLGRKVTTKEMDKILKEIDAAPGPTGDVLTIVQQLTAGMIDLRTAAECSGYDPDVVDAAAKDHADRIARIQEAQSSNIGPNGAARGNPDSDPDPLASPDAEKTTSQNQVISKKVAGANKIDQPGKATPNRGVG